MAPFNTTPRTRNTDNNNHQHQAAGRRISTDPNTGDVEDHAPEVVKVAVRLRPLSEHENSWSAVECLRVDPSAQQVRVFHSENSFRDDRIFTFDNVYGSGSTHMDLHQDLGKPLVEALLQGSDACLFAYGMTGSGKTHSMTGLSSMIFSDLYRSIDEHKARDPSLSINVSCSYTELYNEALKDLLCPPGPRANGGPLVIRETSTGGVHVKGLTEHPCGNIKEMTRLKNLGESTRKSAGHRLNLHSSRSHAIFTVKVTIAAPPEHGKENTRSPPVVLSAGRLHLVDLAGSERLSKTCMAEAEMVKEAGCINKSLGTLGEVISKLAKGGSTDEHIPFRNSKLTRLLQESLSSANCQTVMLATVSPADMHMEETLQTLSYATRAKAISNKECPGARATRALRSIVLEAKALRAEISALEASLAGRDANPDEVMCLAAKKARLVSVCAKADKERDAVRSAWAIAEGGKDGGSEVKRRMEELRCATLKRMKVADILNQVLPKSYPGRDETVESFKAREGDLVSWSRAYEAARGEARRNAESFVEALGSLCAPGGGGRGPAEGCRDAARSLMMQVGSLEGHKEATKESAKWMQDGLEGVLNTVILTSERGGNGRDPYVIDCAERLAALEDLEYARARLSKLEDVLETLPGQVCLPAGGGDMAKIAVESLADRYPGLRKGLMKISGGMKELEGEKGVKEAVDAAMEALKMIERAGFAEEEVEVNAEGGVEEVGTNTTPGKEGGGGGGEKIGELEGRLKEARERARAEGDAREAAEGRVEELEGELNSLRESLLHVRDAIRADRDALCGERDAAVSERDALRSECGLLRGEMDALSSERDAAVSERDALSHGAQVLRGEVDALSQQVAEMQGEGKDRASMLARMQELESQVITANEAEIKVKTILEDVSKLTARAERAVELEVELSTVKTEAEANAKSLTAQVDSARSDVGEALEALGAMEVELNKCREELEGKRAGEFEAAEGLAELLDHERNQVLRLEAEVGVLREAAAKREEDMASLREARDADADLKSEIADRDAKIADLLADIAGLRADLGERDAKMEDVALKLACAFEEAAALRESEQSLVDRIEAMRCERDGLEELLEAEKVERQREVEEARERSRKLEEDLELARKEVMRLEGELTRAKGQGEELVGALEGERGGAQALVDELERVKSEIIAVKGELEGERRRVMSLEEEAEGAKKELEEATKRLAALDDESEGELAGVKNEVVALVKMVEGLQTDLALKNSKVTSLETDSVRKEEEALNLRSDLGERDAKVQDIETRLEGIVAESNQKLTSLESDLAGKDAELVELTARLGEKDAEVSRLDAQLQDQLSSLQNIGEEKARLVGLLADKEAFVGELEGTVESKEAAIEELQGTVKSREEDNGRLTSRLADKEEQVMSLESAATDSKVQIAILEGSLGERDAMLTSTVTDLNEKVSSLESGIAEKDAKVASLERDLAKQGSQHESLEADLGHKVESFQSDLAAKEAKLALLESQLSHKEEEAQKLRSGVEANDNQVASLEAEVADLTACLGERDSRLATVERELADKESEASQLACDLSDKSAEVETLSSQLAESGSKVAGLEVCLGGALNAVSLLEECSKELSSEAVKTLEAERARACEAEKRLSEMEIEQARLREAVESADHRASGLEGERENAKREIEALVKLVEAVRGDAEGARERDASKDADIAAKDEEIQAKEQEKTCIRAELLEAIAVIEKLEGRRGETDVQLEKARADLEAALSERDAKVSSLERDLEEKVSSLKAEVEEAMRERESAEEEAAQAKDEAGKRAMELEEMAEASLNEKEDADRRCDNLEARLKASQEQLIDKGSEVQGLTAKLDEKTALSEKLAAKLVDKESQVLSLDQKVLSLRSAAEQAAADLSQLRTELEAKAAELRGGVDDLEARLDELANESRRVESDKDGEIQTLSAASAEKVASLEACASDLESRIKELEATLASKEEEKEEIYESLSALLVEKEGLVSERDAISASNEDLVKDKEAATELLADGAARMEQLEGEIERIAASAESSDAKVSSLEADLGERDAKVSSLEADLAARDDRIQELTIAEAFAKDNAVSVEKVSELEDALKIQEDKIKKLEGELEEAREDRGGVEHVMKSLTDEEMAEAETAFEALNNADVWEDARGDSPYSRRSVNASINSIESSPLPALSELAGSRLGRVVSKIMRDAARKAREQVEKKEEERQELVLQLLEAKGSAEQERQLRREVERSMGQRVSELEAQVEDAPSPAREEKPTNVSESEEVMQLRTLTSALLSQVERLKQKLEVSESDKESSKAALDKLAQMMSDGPPEGSSWGGSVKDAAAYFRNQIEAAAAVATPHRLRLPSRPAGATTPSTSNPTPSRSAMSRQAGPTPSRIVLGSMVRPAMEGIAQATLSPQQTQALLKLAQSAVLPISPNLGSPAATLVAMSSPRGGVKSPRAVIVSPNKVLSPRSPLGVLPTSEAVKRRGCRITNGGGSVDKPGAAGSPVKSTPVKDVQANMTPSKLSENRWTPSKVTPSKMNFFSPGKLKMPSIFSKRSSESSHGKENAAAAATKENDGAINVMSPVTEASPAAKSASCAPASDRLSMFDESPAVVTPSVVGESPELDGGWALAALLPSPNKVFVQTDSA